MYYIVLFLYLYLYRDNNLTIKKYKIMKYNFLFLPTSILLLLVCCKPKNNIEQAPAEYPELTIIYEVPALPASQQIGGTCWAFSTNSFLESEIYRTKGRFIELSAMYLIYNKYSWEAENYILRQGVSRLSEGGCNYDPLVNLDRTGLMPRGTYTGDNVPDLGKASAELSARVKDFAIPGNKSGGSWRTEIPLILNTHIGKPAETFIYEGKRYTAREFLDFTGLKAEDYVNLTSFTHAPQDRFFNLTIPANWSGTPYFNVSLDEYMANINHALANGYSMTIDTDLVEPEVFILQGFALMFADSPITPEKRQSDFESFATTDDHNMHLVGKVLDQDGNIYYKCKNSWGENFGMDGYYYLSEDYVRSKSIYVMLHKDGLTEITRAKIAAS